MKDKIPAQKRAHNNKTAHKKITRRGFVKVCLSGASAGVAAAAGINLSGCASAPRHLLQTPESGEKPSLPLSALDEEGRVVVVDTKSAKNYLIVRDGEQFSAVELTCTHRGCALQVRRAQLYCPCHGSRFSTDGQVLEGPAEQALISISVTRQGDSLILDKI